MKISTWELVFVVRQLQYLKGKLKNYVESYGIKYLRVKIWNETILSKSLLKMTVKIC